MRKEWKKDKKFIFTEQKENVKTLIKILFVIFMKASYFILNNKHLFVCYDERQHKILTVK
jgi:hypothetical protein